MAKRSSLSDVVKELGSRLATFPTRWDARESITTMKEAGSRHWKQMEWMGFYFEFLCQHHLSSVLEMPGPSYGNVGFDAFAVVPWDCKAHAINTSSHQIIVNDSEAMAQAIGEHRSVGLILAVGEVDYNDEQRTFQQWHEELKGGPSGYTKKRIERGAWSRLRKTNFRLEEVHLIRIDDDALVKCGAFQEDFRNSDGSPRRRKVLLDLEELDKEILDTVRFKPC